MRKQMNVCVSACVCARLCAYEMQPPAAPHRSHHRYGQRLHHGRRYYFPLARLFARARL